jgi:hypothetical protein
MKRSITTLFAVAALTACSGSGTSSESETDAASTGSETTDPGSTSMATSGTTDAETTATPETDSDPTTQGTTTEGPDTDTAAESSTGEATEGTTTGGMEDVTIQGSWLSEGDNVAPLLVDLANTVSIAATFDEMTFTVVSTDADGQEVEQAGVYVVEPTEFGNIMEITLEQSSPQTITAEGIFEIDNSTNPPTMRYEVVQTVPSVGAQQPTAEGGFGATALGSDLTQVFVWQDA